MSGRTDSPGAVLLAVLAGLVTGLGALVFIGENSLGSAVTAVGLLIGIYARMLQSAAFHRQMMTSIRGPQ